MAAETWSEWSFEEVIDFQEGPGILAKDFREEGVPLVRLSGLERNGSVLEGCNYLDPGTVNKRWSHFALQQGDILLSTSASLGRIAVVGEDAVGAIPYTGIIRMRPRDERLFAPFIRYLLEGPEFQQQAEMVGVGSVIRHFGPMHLRQMNVRLPPPQEQRAIAKLLGTLDDKIELNQRMNETLEAVARTIFKSWFVDCDPVRAKAEGRDPGPPPLLADLFPAGFDESEGGIPTGWQVRTIDEEFNLTMGQSPPGETYNHLGEGLPFYQGRADFGFRLPSHRVFCTAPTRFANVGDTLISVRAPVGDINMAAEYCCIGRGVAAARHKSGSRSYTYYFMRSLEEVFDSFEAEGTVFGSISKKDFHGIRRIAPPTPVVDAFEDIVAPFDERIVSNDCESRTVTALREALLPKLISGELRLANPDGPLGNEV